jgi:DNA-binding NarL/FixJ family response regulator
LEPLPADATLDGMTRPAAAPDALPLPRPLRVRVLVVDDAPAFRAAAAAVVGRTPGFVLVGEAVDGGTALAQVSALVPDLVLLDIHLPDVDGIEVCARLDRPPHVVLCSTYAVGDLPASALTCGALAYLPKDDLRPAVLERLWATRPAAPSRG